MAGISTATVSRQIKNRIGTPENTLLALRGHTIDRLMLLDEYASGWLSVPDKSFSGIRTGAPQSGTNALAYGATVSGNVRLVHSRGRNAARSDCLFKERLQ